MYISPAEEEIEYLLFSINEANENKECPRPVYGQECEGQEKNMPRKLPTGIGKELL